MARIGRSLALPLLACAPAVLAATEAQIEAAFAQAQKKGAVAVVDQRCGTGFSSVYFPNAGARSLAKTAAALGALAAVKADDAGPGDGCAPGMHEGDSRLLELYPDGSVRIR